MANPPYDQPPTPSDGQLYPIYPEFYDLGSPGHSADAAAIAAAAAAAAACGGDGAAVGGGTLPGWGWGYGLVDLELAYPPPQGFVGGDGDGLQLRPSPQVPWDSGAQAYPAMVGGQGALVMGSPMAHYAPGEEPSGGYFEPPTWAPPPLGQISPSPSQSSYYASSPASAGGAQFSRHNSWSSLPASRTPAVEQTRFDARFWPVPEQVFSPDEPQPSSAGFVAANGFRPGTEPAPPSTGQKRGPRKGTGRQTMAARKTASYNASAASPALTASPKDSSGAAPYQQQSPESSKKRAHAAAQQAQQQEEHTETGRRQPQQKPQQQQQQAQPQGQTQPQHLAQKSRNRAAANKCRAKSKLAAADLESAERAMSNEHRELSATARGLRDEVLLLKNELLAHGNCDDASIQQYLTNQARMVGSSGGRAAAQDLYRPHEQQ